MLSCNNKIFFHYLWKKSVNIFLKISWGFIPNVCKFCNLRYAICFVIQIATHLESHDKPKAQPVCHMP